MNQRLAYIKKYEFEGSRTVIISSRYKIYDDGFCISNSYSTLNEAEQALERYITKTLGLDYTTKREI